MKKTRIIGIVISVCCIFALAAAGMYWSAGQSGRDTHESPMGQGIAGSEQNSPGLPPAEAVTACSGKRSGDVCRFFDRDVTRSGTCDEKPGVLACAPDREQNAGPSAPDAPGAMTSRTMLNTSPILATPAVHITPGSGTPGFTLTSNAGSDGSAMPDLYTCDGAGLTPALTWSGAPSGTKEYALMMTTVPVDGSTRWNWVLYSIPGNLSSLARNSTGVGITGTGSHGTVMQYDPPCPQGPGAKVYTFTLYALSGSPALPSGAAGVTGEILTTAITPVTLGKASFNLSYARSA